MTKKPVAAIIDTKYGQFRIFASTRSYEDVLAAVREPRSIQFGYFRVPAEFFEGAEIAWSLDLREWINHYEECMQIPTLSELLSALLEKALTTGRLSWKGSKNSRS